MFSYQHTIAYFFIWLLIVLTKWPVTVTMCKPLHGTVL